MDENSIIVTNHALRAFADIRDYIAIELPVKKQASLLLEETLVALMVRFIFQSSKDHGDCSMRMH